MRNRRFDLMLGTALAVVMAAPGAALAQSQPVTEEIVVTAQKREERLIDVPAAVTAVTGATLVQHNLTRIEEFAAHTPGLTFNEAGAGVQVTIRGLNASGQGATTAILVDDVPLTSASSYQQISTPNFDTYDLARIEVLRGPQGTLYGASSLGGLVKYVTKAPDLGRVEGAAQVELNHVLDGQAGASARAALNVPLVENELAVRVSGLYERVPGYIDNVLGSDPDVNRQMRYGLRASLLWQPGTRLRVKLGAVWQRDSLHALPLTELVGAFANPTNPSPDATSVAHGGDLQQNSRIALPVVRSAQVYSATVNYDLDAATITSITSYARSGYNQHQDYTNESAGPGLSYGDLLTAFVYGQPVGVDGHNVASIRRLNQELRIGSAPDRGLFGLPVDYVAGLFYADEHSRLTQSFDVLTVARPVRVLTTPLPGGTIDVPASYREFAGFGQLTWHVASDVDLVAGGRYGRNWQTSQARKYFGFATQQTGDVFDAPSSAQEGKATWSAALSWHPVERVNLYARVATGFRPGGPNATAPVILPGYEARYRSDTTVNYELGAKGLVLDRRLSFDIALFSIDWSQIQIPSSTINPATSVPFNFTTNGGKARSRGLEYALRFALAEPLSLSVSGAWTEAELRAGVPTIGGRQGDALPYVPDFTNTTSLDYRVPVGADTALFAGVDWTYVGPRYSEFVANAAATGTTNHQRLPSYDAVNLRGGVEFGRQQLDVYLTNVGDARGLYSYRSTAGANGTGTGVVQQPRTFGVRFSSSF